MLKNKEIQSTVLKHVDAKFLFGIYEGTLIVAENIGWFVL